MPGQRDACADGPWSAPTPLLTPATNPPPVARNPALVRLDTGLVVIGNNVLANDQPVRVGTTLTVWQVGRGSLGTPRSESAFVFLSPKATRDPRGRLHLLWAEPPTHPAIIPPYQWTLLETTSLWAATYDAERGWSTPARLYAGGVDWNWTVASGPIVEGADGSRLLAVPTPARTVLVLSLEAEAWRVASVPVETPPAYVSVLATGTTRLLAVVRADPTQPADRNSIFLYRQDQGGPWRLVHQVQRSGAQAAMELRLLNGRNGRVHLVWRQMLRDDAFVLRHAHSDDQGASWSTPDDLRPSGLLQNLEAVVDACGRLHVAFEDWSQRAFDAVRIGYATWDGAWSPPTLLFPDYRAGNLALSPGTDGSLLLAFLGTAGDPADARQWAMLAAHRR